jgi:hypothetical protein
MKTKKGFVLIASFFISGLLYCQETAFKHFPFQVSFVYPIGIHGTQSVDFTYDFSLNMLAGITGSIDGFEIGGLLNINRGNMSGCQIGGIGNITNGNADGLQMGGIFSLADRFEGIQINGIFSKCTELEGLQINGIFSKCTDSKGLQISGILNSSTSAKSSIAGIANLNTGNQQGIQMAGIYNQAKELKGVQIGLINMADTISKGIPIGLINLIKKGYYDEWTFSVADYLNLAISYKLGVKHFYTIYTLGMNLIKDQLWVVGLGFGHLHEVNPKFSIQPEIVCYNYYPMNFVRKIRDTWISHFKLGFVRNLNQNLAFSIAPSMYLSLKSNRGIYDNYGYEQSPVNELFDVDRPYNNNRLGFGFGLCLGLTFK